MGLDVRLYIFGRYWLVKTDSLGELCQQAHAFGTKGNNHLVYQYDPDWLFDCSQPPNGALDGDGLAGNVAHLRNRGTYRTNHKSDKRRGPNYIIFL